MRNRYESIKVVLNLLGSLFLLLSGILLIPLISTFFFGEIGMSNSFLIPIILSLFIGIILKIIFPYKTPNEVQGMMLCGLGWFAISIVGAMPFWLGLDVSFLDSYFETVSGFTTTGITMLSGLDDMSRSILFWRSLTQWLGGLGFLTFFILVMKGEGAHLLFGAESHKISAHRPVPGVKHTIKLLWIIYGCFTVLIAFLLLFSGLSIFDSINHALTTLSTGGFSPYDASIAHYKKIGHDNYILIEYIIILGMALGGMNFLIHYRVLNGKLDEIKNDFETKLWWGFIAVFMFFIFLERSNNFNIFQGFNIFNLDSLKMLESNFRSILFQILAVLTTTGFGTVDIGSRFFGSVARQLFLVMMVIGGCVGSTGGGIKAKRIGILFKLLKREITKIIYPNSAVVDVIVDGEKIDGEEISRISGLFFMWIFLLVVGGLFTALLSSHGPFESMSGMFSALGNIGPSYISVSDLNKLNPFIKIVYILGMLVGRLEILPVLVLFHKKAWK
ncbi:MAG: TrkH family potassium uptake protein [Fusobacteriota bacterium]